MQGHLFFRFRKMNMFCEGESIMNTVLKDRNNLSQTNDSTLIMPEGFISSEEYEKNLSEEEQEFIQEKAREMFTELKLEQLRKSFKVSQKELAEKMRATQSQVSKIEKNQNLEIRTLRRFLSSLGLEMVIYAKREDGELIPITKSQ